MNNNTLIQEMNMNKEQRTARIIEMKKNGATYKEIMREVDVCQQVVYSTLFRAGLTSKKRAKKIDEEKEKQIVEMRKNGATYMELSVQFNVSTPVINKILRRNGLTKKK